MTTAPVALGDVIGIGHGRLHLDGERLVAFVDVGGNTSGPMT